MNWLNELLQNDPDPTETREWIESIKAVIDNGGPQRAHQLLEGMVELTRRAGAHLPFSPTTEYINTIPAGQEAKSPCDAAMEWRLGETAGRCCVSAPTGTKAGSLRRCRPGAASARLPVCC